MTCSVEFSNASLGIWVLSAVVPTMLADDGTCQILSVPYPGIVAGKKVCFFPVRVDIAP